jgi:hypothetical protein
MFFLLGGPKKKKAKVVTSGTNTLASPGIPVTPAPGEFPPVGDLSTLRDTANSLVSTLQELARNQQQQQQQQQGIFV